MKRITSNLNCDKSLSLFQTVAKKPECDKKSLTTRALQQYGGKKATFILVVIAGGRSPNLHYLIFRYVSSWKIPPKNLAALIDRFSESTKVLHAFDAIDGNKVEPEVRRDKALDEGRHPAAVHSPAAAGSSAE